MDWGGVADARPVLKGWIWPGAGEHKIDRMGRDVINHPAHYQKNGRECIDVMIEKFGTEAVINFCECNEFKYLWRAGLKEGNSAETDRAKAAWYRKKAKELRGI